MEYRLIFLLIFLYLIRLKAHKDISLYFKRGHLIINYFHGNRSFVHVCSVIDDNDYDYGGTMVDNISHFRCETEHKAAKS